MTRPAYLAWLLVVLGTVACVTSDPLQPTEIPDAPDTADVAVPIVPERIEYPPTPIWVTGETWEEKLRALRNNLALAWDYIPLLQDLIDDHNAAVDAMDEE
jgi:hypothetical protein